MNEPPSAEAQQARLDRFFDSLREAQRAVLLLDYDGTIAPFREERDRAFPYPGVVEILENIARSGRTRVVFVSGRSVDALLRLLRLPFPAEIWGTHGAEHKLPDGDVVVAPLERGARVALRQAEDCARLLGYEGALEVKPASVALHWRGRSASWMRGARNNVVTCWTRIAARAPAEVLEFDGGVELRARGLHKGRVVQQVLREEPESVPVAYLGDDLTDEDAFRALGGQGLSVLVRQSFRPTEAELWLRPPEELLEFLNRWAETTGGQT